jgi:precorrin 3B synthase CobZ
MRFIGGGYETPPGGLRKPDGVSTDVSMPSPMIAGDLDPSERVDVLVIGGGNAALCAAISARRTGANVLVLEAAPRFYRGGNTRHTRNMRCAHDSATETLTGPYTEDEFWEDLKRVTQGQTDEELARHMIAESKEMLTWIVDQGVRFQRSLGGTLSLGRTNSFFLGGGRAMLNALYLTAEQLGVRIRYDAEVTELSVERGMFLSATVKQPSGTEVICAGALVAASGGFEANIEWLKQGWGEIADNMRLAMVALKGRYEYGRLDQTLKDEKPWIVAVYAAIQKRLPQMSAISRRRFGMLLEWYPNAVKSAPAAEESDS